MEVVTSKSKDKRNLDELHSYACPAEHDGECSSSPNTPVKPKSKKSKGCVVEEKEPTLHELQDTIIDVISKKIEERADKIDRAVKYNSDQINELKQSIEFCHAEVVVLKKENETLKVQVAELQKDVAGMEVKQNVQDAYSRRHNLRLYGVPEKEEDDIKARVQEICRAVVPVAEARSVVPAVDVVHRLGRRKTGETRPRPVIIRFQSRTARDAVWKCSNKNDHLKTNRLYFKEDLTEADRERRNRLWPAVEEARKRGDKASFNGGRAFINGKEVVLK